MRMHLTCGSCRNARSIACRCESGMWPMSFTVRVPWLSSAYSTKSSIAPNWEKTMTFSSAGTVFWTCSTTLVSFVPMTNLLVSIRFMIDPARKSPRSLLSFVDLLVTDGAACCLSVGESPSLSPSSSGFAGFITVKRAASPSSSSSSSSSGRAGISTAGVAAAAAAAFDFLPPPSVRVAFFGGAFLPLGRLALPPSPLSASSLPASSSSSGASSIT
mmetsp:Transcript_26567/g.82115  ORF Transcript_26567/g.82115 Transcript_26567/m.82115 type:complete len:216 (-) Transcript_26567:3373-4020(-)